MMETALDRLIAGNQGAASRGGRPVPASSGTRQRRNPNVSLTRPKPGVAASNNDDDGFDAGDIFKPLGRLAMGAINTVDMGRAAVVSATRELADAVDSEEDASWTDFRNQFNRRATSQELLFTGPHFGLDEKGWEDEILGFATDVVLDPLTYVPGGLAARQAIKVGAKGLALTAPEKALKVAVKDGSSKTIAKTVAANAAEAGIKDAPEVQKLIVQAAGRGRGALTEKGLREAGVTAAQREALGLAASQPGNARALLQFAENVKGAVKQGARESAIGFKTRKLFTPESMGRLAFANDAFNKNLGFDRRAQAVLATGTINPAKALANKWGALTMKRAELAMMGTRKARGLWADMDDQVARVTTRNIETGVAGEAEDVVRTELRTMYDNMKDAGVDLGDMGPDYVPHFTTDKFKEWAKKNPEEAKLVTSIMSKEGLQQFRTIRQGKEFMGEPLEEGSIGEINERFASKYGFNMFEDDMRVIMPKYVKASERAMGRAKQIELLGELGFTREVGTKLVRRTDDEFKAEIKDIKGRIAAAKQAQKVAWKEGSKQRRGTLLQLRDYTNKRKVELQQRMVQVRNELNEAARRQRAAQDSYDTAVREADNNRQRVADLENIFKNSLGRDVADVRRELENARSQQRGLEANVVKARQEAERIMGAAGPTRGAKRAARKEARPFVARATILSSERDALVAQIDELAAEAADYKQMHAEAMNGIFPPNMQNELMRANDVMEFWLKQVPGAAQKKDLAEAVFLFAEADARFSLDQLNRRIGELDAVLDNELSEIPQVRAGQIAGRNELRNRFNAVKAVLERQGNPPELQAIAQLEAIAAKADMDALMAGRQVKQLKDMLEATKSNGFQKRMKSVGKGMTQLGENKQMPSWISDATMAEVVKNELPFFGKWGQRYFGLFKGYAVLRPGFHVRNAYSAMFNMYLEAGAGSFKNVKKWHDFYTKATHDPENYMKWAVDKFGEVEARRLDDAFSVISATGGGQAATEFSDTTFRKASKNPFDQNNAALLKSRKWGGWVEDHVRGAHAYDVLSRGGTIDQATDVITKWHFDYNDVTKFDQAMKLVNPFWIFFSRNLALQSQTWLSALPKINRTMVNLERNLNYGFQDDEIVPEYFFTEGATKTPIKGFGGGNLFWFSDLPAMTFPGELDRLSDPTDTRFFADLGPFLKIPVELAADRQMFSNVPIDPNKPAQLPFGVGNLPGAGTLGGLPGFDTAASGQLLMNPELLNVVQSAIPGLGQSSRLVPIGSEKGSERLPYSWLSYLTGIGLSENNERAQRGEMYRRMFEQEAQAKRQETLSQL